MLPPNWAALLFLSSSRKRLGDALSGGTSNGDRSSSGSPGASVVDAGAATVPASVNAKCTVMAAASLSVQSALPGRLRLVSLIVVSSTRLVTAAVVGGDVTCAVTLPFASLTWVVTPSATL